MKLAICVVVGNEVWKVNGKRPVRG
jgi:hypothetical protein